MTLPGPPDDLDRLLFACDSCAVDLDCRECVQLTAGAWCVHLCWWTLLPRSHWPEPRGKP